MMRMIVGSRTDADGVSRVTAHGGRNEADREVSVAIEWADEPLQSQAACIAWLEGIAGKRQGDFERFPETFFQERDSPGRSCWP
jgi:hypothetical protein